jgi:hypothetical protein
MLLNTGSHDDDAPHYPALIQPGKQSKFDLNAFNLVNIDTNNFILSNLLSTRIHLDPQWTMFDETCSPPALIFQLYEIFSKSSSSHAQLQEIQMKIPPYSDPGFHQSMLDIVEAGGPLETISHFLLHCPHLDDIREDFKHSLSLIDPSLSNIPLSLCLWLGCLSAFSHRNSEEYKSFALSLHAFTSGNMNTIPPIPDHFLNHPLQPPGTMLDLNASQRRKIITLSGKYLLKMQSKREKTLKKLLHSKVFPDWFNFQFPPDKPKDVNFLFKL